MELSTEEKMTVNFSVKLFFCRIVRRRKVSLQSLVKSCSKSNLWCIISVSYTHLMDQMVGQYVGQVREACQQALEDIRSSCFAVKDFLYPQTKRLVDWISRQYDRPIEYLWDRSPDSGVFRHQKDLKWFGVLMKIDWSKLDARQEGKIEVLNIKQENVSQLLEEPHFYPAYHMNKKYWISIPLDGRVEDDLLFKLVAKSWALTRSCLLYTSRCV